MTFFLDAVAFNHDASTSVGNALSVRGSGEVSVALPEWRRGISVRASDAPAAYAIAPNRDAEITVLARFTGTDVGGPVSVRAVQVEGSGPLGALPEVQVQLGPSGTSPFVAFPAPDSRLADAGVGAHRLEWRWQARNPGGTWRDIAVTEHAIYVVLDEPTAPWLQAPLVADNGQLPWLGVLDHACRWAAGATGTGEAAALVTAAVFALGTGLFEYNCQGLGSAQYSWPYFDCSAFLERLGGGFGNGRFLNCSDCAAIVSTFANVLGCDLWQSKMGLQFPVNPVQVIGSPNWRVPCGWGEFTMHEVAWSGSATEDDLVYDACLRLDADAVPAADPRAPLLPSGLQFGPVNSGLYRDHLAAAAGRSRCQPLPETRVRRFVV